MNFTIQAVGVVHSALRKLEDCPLQEAESAYEATIELFDEYTRAAMHIRPGDTLLLLTWLDKADRSVLETHPRNDPANELTGIFSTRSPNRPNPIGLHEVSILTKEGAGIFKVSALEVLDGTPIIDIKSL